MASHLGKEGVFKISATTVAQFRNYALNVQGATTDVSVIGDDWDRKKGTTNSWGLTIGTWWDPADAGQILALIGTTVTVLLYPMGQATSATYYSGSVIVTGNGAQGDRSGASENGLSFEGAGTLSTLTV